MIVINAYYGTFYEEYMIFKTILFFSSNLDYVKKAYVTNVFTWYFIYDFVFISNGKKPPFIDAIIYACKKRMV